jgi:hypothetical protein
LIAQGRIEVASRHRGPSVKVKRQRQEGRFAAVDCWSLSHCLQPAEVEIRVSTQPAISGVHRKSTAGLSSAKPFHCIPALLAFHGRITVRTESMLLSIDRPVIALPLNCVAANGTVAGTKGSGDNRKNDDDSNYPGDCFHRITLGNSVFLRSGTD